MSEYIEIETEMSDDGATMYFHTNLQLAQEGVEEYESAEAMEVGSPVAQMLSPIEGIVYLRLEGKDMTVTRDPEAAWHIIVADVSAALEDFFL
jgi:Mg2+/citrate symporter